MKLITPALILVLSLTVAGSIAYAHGGESDNVVCPAIYAPVCASHPVQCIKAPCYPQYQTFGNSCEAGAHEATVLHQGECTASETGPVKPSTETYTPPKGCVAWFDGCNTCRDTGNGAACTKRACLAPAAGYCTEYGKPTTSEPTTPAPIATDTPAAATSTPEVHVPFYVMVWQWISNLFGW